MEKCGQYAGSLVPRWGLYFACVLDKGHAGDCQPGGTCRAHGDYVGQGCPKWPDCVIEIFRMEHPYMNGAELIAAERQRQIDVEGWTAEHDDAHTKCQMLIAGCGYATLTYMQVHNSPELLELAQTIPPPDWPWEKNWWKPSTNPIRNLIKAGALIAAEIDRLQRVNNLNEQLTKEDFPNPLGNQ